MDNTELVSLMEKAPQDLTPAELAKIQSWAANTQKVVEERLKAISDTAQKTVFGEIGDMVTSLISTKLGWTKLPKLILTGEDVKDAAGTVTGQKYAVNYQVAKVRATSGGTSTAGTTTRGDPNSGKITVKKIGDTFGGIDKFEVGGKSYDSIKELLKDLKFTDGTPEFDHCWETTNPRKGVSSSEILASRHAGEVTLILKNKERLLYKDAITKMESARKAEPAV